MEIDKYDEHVTKIAVSIYKAVCRPEILPYMRKQLIQNIVSNLNTLTEEEIRYYLESLKVLLSDETKKERPL